jgi:hypothetical protein
MEPKNGNMKLTELTLRNILVTIIVIGALTGGNLWLHRGDPPLGYGRYDNFGLTFEYPLLFNVVEAGFPDPSAGANDFMGLAQAQGVWENEYHNYFVIWATESSIPELGDTLEEIYLALADSGCVIDSKEPIVSKEKEGQELLYQTITFTQAELDFIGTIGVWYEPWSSFHANRVYMVSYITFQDAASSLQVEETFLTFKDTINSNNGEGAK